MGKDFGARTAGVEVLSLCSEQVSSIPSSVKWDAADDSKV